MRKHFSDEWGKYPFAWLVVPLMAGITVTEYIKLQGGLTVACILLGILFILFTLLVNFQSFKYRFLSGMVLYLFYFMTGGILCELKYRSLQVTFPDHPCLSTAVLMSNASPGTRSVQCQAWLLSCADSTMRQPIGEYVMLSFSPDSASRHLKAGDVIRYYGQTHIPERNSNPGMFDYAGYLRHQGISGTARISSYAWDKTEETVHLPLPVRFILTFRQTRNRLLAAYRTDGADDKTISVLSALTLGEVAGLPQQLKDDYSTAGASHILALSGSHLAVIYTVLEILFGFSLYRWKGGRTTGRILIILLIWAFAFLAGSQPSVIRAAVMYTMLVGATLCSRSTLALNSLFFAAFLMLLADPFALFDIGAQLSFLAVFGIFLFNEKLYKRLVTPYRIVNYLLLILTVSVSVQIISLPLILYCFSAFPLYFLLTNLLVVPLSSVILLAAIAGFALWAVPDFIARWIRLLLYKLTEWQNAGVELIASLPGASLQFPGVNLLTTVYLYLLLGFILLRKYMRPLPRWYTTGLMCLAGILIAGYQWIERRTDKYIVFYDNRRCPAMHLVQGTDQGILFPAWKDSIDAGMTYIAGTAWKKQGIPYPRIVTPEEDILALSGYRVLLLKDFRWVNQKLKKRLPVDYVWICRGYYGNLSRTLSSFAVRQIILDASLSEKYRLRYLHECRELQLPCHDMAEKGACIINL